jgi:hypothetical protein
MMRLRVHKTAEKELEMSSKYEIHVFLRQVFVLIILYIKNFKLKFKKYNLSRIQPSLDEKCAKKYVCTLYSIDTSTVFIGIL